MGGVAGGSTISVAAQEDEGGANGIGESVVFCCRSSEIVNGMDLDLEPSQSLRKALDMVRGRCSPPVIPHFTTVSGPFAEA